MILLVPFIIELFADAVLIKKGKKDLPLWLRIFMIAGVSVDDISLLATAISHQDVAIATAPFFLLDPALNIVRGKPWDYQGQTKWWDRVFMKMLNKTLNPRAVLVLRGLGTAGLLYFGLT